MRATSKKNSPAKSYEEIVNDYLRGNPDNQQAYLEGCAQVQEWERFGDLHVRILKRAVEQVMKARGMEP